MKTKVFFLCIMLFSVATFYLPSGFARDLFLPEGTRARLGVTFRCPKLQEQADEGVSSENIVNHLWDFDYFPDSRHIVLITAASSASNIAIYNADTAEKLPQRTFMDYSGAREVVVSPDGESIALGNLSGAIYLIRYDIRTNQNKLVNGPGGWWGTPPTYVPIAWIDESGGTLVTVEQTGETFFSSRIHMSNWAGTVRQMVHEHKWEDGRLHPIVENIGFWGGRLATASQDGIIYISDGPRKHKFTKYQLGDYQYERFEASGSYYRTFNANPNFPDPVPLIEVLVTLQDYYYAMSPYHPPRSNPNGSTLMKMFDFLPLDSTGNPANTFRLYENTDGNGMTPDDLKYTFKGHTGCIWNVVYSEDGQWIASASADGTIRLWDPDPPPTEIFSSTRTFESYTLRLSNLAFSPDGKRVAIGQWDGKVVLSPSNSGIGASTFKGHTGPVTSVAFHPKLPILATASTDGNLGLWSLETYPPVPIKHDLLNRNVPLTSVAFSPDGRTLAAGGVDGALHLWSIDAAGDVRGLPDRLTGHKDSVFKVMFSRDGRTLASGSDDGTVLLWDHKPAPGWKPSDPVEFKPGDVNGDGEVNLQDLIFVNTNLGKTGENPADVNQDEVVDIQDLLLVAAALDEAAAAPTAWYSDLELPLTRTQVAQWLAQAQQLSLTEGISQGGLRFLGQLLAVLTPQETTLLANYPNPFNPETWIPYRLAEPADVTVRIYAMDGSLVRTLVLGHQAAGIYQSSSRAAYWDGKNELSEAVASGAYFYTLTAGEFSATRKLLIQK